MATADQILREFGITVPRMRGGNVKTKCPVCGPTRTNKNDPSLSVKIDKEGVTFLCHHCGNKGGKYYDQQGTYQSTGKPSSERGKRLTVGDLQRSSGRLWR